MSISSFKHLAFDNDANITNKNFPLKNGAELEIYKNFAYIHHEAAWFAENGFSKNTVMYVYNGHFDYAGCEIVIDRNSYQNACFVFIHDCNYVDNIHKFYCGLGCHTYLSILDYTKIHNPEKLELLPKNWRRKKYMEMTSDKGAGLTFIKGKGNNVVFNDVYIYNKEPDTTVGISPELYKRFLSWLKRLAKDANDLQCEYIEKIIKKIKCNIK